MFCLCFVTVFLSCLGTTMLVFYSAVGIGDFISNPKDSFPSPDWNQGSRSLKSKVINQKSSYTLMIK